MCSSVFARLCVLAHRSVPARPASIVQVHCLNAAYASTTGAQPLSGDQFCGRGRNSETALPRGNPGALCPLDKSCSVHLPIPVAAESSAASAGRQACERGRGCHTRSRGAAERHDGPQALGAVVQKGMLAASDAASPVAVMWCSHTLPAGAQGAQRTPGQRTAACCQANAGSSQGGPPPRHATHAHARVAASPGRHVRGARRRRSGPLGRRAHCMTTHLHPTPPSPTPLHLGPAAARQPCAAGRGGRRGAHVPGVHHRPFLPAAEQLQVSGARARALGCARRPPSPPPPATPTAAAAAAAAARVAPSDARPRAPLPRSQGWHKPLQLLVGEPQGPGREVCACSSPWAARTGRLQSTPEQRGSPCNRAARQCESPSAAGARARPWRAPRAPAGLLRKPRHRRLSLRCAPPQSAPPTHAARSAACVRVAAGCWCCGASPRRCCRACCANGRWVALPGVGCGHPRCCTRGAHAAAAPVATRAQRRPCCWHLLARPLAAPNPLPPRGTPATARSKPRSRTCALRRTWSPTPRRATPRSLTRPRRRAWRCGSTPATRST